ncbi:hypothetical protein C8R46DRAFT_1259192 [Mycena filopes]|nr:hypothetical protein C8R46DRAFT_1259192 [Mycena filopes]
MHVEQDVAAKPTIDARISNQRLISDGVDLVFALREAEDTLAQLGREDPSHHSIPYLLQQGQVDQRKQELADIVARLNALPHTPVNIEPDLEPLRVWMNANREKFDAFKKFCDEYRAPSPMEEGQVHPELAKLWSVVGDLERRVVQLEHKRDRFLEYLEPIVNPRGYEFQQQVRRLKELDRQHTEMFSMFMSKVAFTDLSEAEQRLAIGQHALQVGRATFEEMLKIEPSRDVVEGVFWLHALGVDTRGMTSEKGSNILEKEEEEVGMDIEFFFQSEWDGTNSEHYTNDGQPVADSGFHSEYCRFAHPEDKEWATANPCTNGPRLPATKYYNSPAYKLSSGPRRLSSSPPQQGLSFYRIDPTSSLRPHAPALSCPAATATTTPSTALPVPPALPAALTNTTDPTPRHLPPQEMKVMWDQVLPLMADCVDARNASQEAQNTLHDFERLFLTERYTVLASPAEMERLTKEHTRLKNVCEERNKDLPAAMERLKATNWWPVGPNQDESAADKYRELVAYARQLNTTAADMYQTYVTKMDQALASGALNDMDVDAPPPHSGSSSRPLKRRRVSDAPMADASRPSEDFEELEQLRSKLEALEDRVSMLNNELGSADTRNADEIAAQIELNGPNPEELQRVEQKVAKTNSEVNALGDAVAELISEGEKIRAQTESLATEKRKQDEEYAAMQQRFLALETETKKDQDTLQALLHAFEALKARPASPVLPLEFILTAIDEPVRDAVRAAVRPMVDDLSRNLQEKIVKLDAETYGQLWGKIALTLKVVEAVSRVTPGMSPVDLP